MESKKSKRKSLSRKQKYFDNDSASSDLSFIGSTSLPTEFAILIVFDHMCSKHVKTKNAVFMNPSVIRAAGAPNFFVLRGSQNSALCIPLPLKTVKRETIILPKDNLGFNRDDVVTLHPYNKELAKTEEVEVCLGVDRKMDLCLKNQIDYILSARKYVSCGLKFRCQDPFHTTEFTINSIKSAGIEASLYNANKTKNDSTQGDCSFSDTNLEMSNSRTSKTGDSSLDNIDSMLSSLNLGDSKFQLKSINKSAQDNRFETNLLNNDSFRNNSLNCDSSQKHSMIDNSLQKHSINNDHSSYPELEDCEFFVFNAETIISDGNTIKKPGKELKQQSLDDIGGLSDVKKCIKTFVDLYLAEGHGPWPTTGVLLLVGPHGTGKSMTMRALQQEYESFEIRWCDLYSKDVSDAVDDLRCLFEAARKSPCIVLMDEYNFLCPTKKYPTQYEIITALRQEMNKCQGFRVVLIASASDRNFDASFLDCNDRYLEEIQFPVPSTDDREQITSKMLCGKKHDLCAADVKQIASWTQGFTGKDIKDILTSAATFDKQDSYNLGDETITLTNVHGVLKCKTPSMRTDMKIKEVRWEDIGGMCDIKSKLRDIVELPLQHPELYARLSIRPSRGVLLYGPPGCSKTMIAKALATECNMYFIAKNVSDIRQKYVGESEKAVSNLFVEARAKAPCIVFLDEIDALVPNRGSGSSVEDKIVSLFLQELDGFLSLDGVVIVAATNRPDRIDSAFLRCGRIDELVYIPLPDVEARHEILQLQMTRRTVGENFDYAHLANITQGYSGAEIKHLCDEAALQVLLEGMDRYVFKMEHFEKALHNVAPRTDKQLLLLYEKFHSELGIK